MSRLRVSSRKDGSARVIVKEHDTKGAGLAYSASFEAGGLLDTFTMMVTMDGRRVRIEIDRTEAIVLRDRLDGALAAWRTAKVNA